MCMKTTYWVAEKEADGTLKVRSGFSKKNIKQALAEYKLKHSKKNFVAVILVPQEVDIDS